MSQQAEGRALAHAALVKSDGSFVISAKTSTDFEMPQVPIEAVRAAADGKPVLIEPRIRNIVGAVVKLRELDGLYLFTIRLVDPQVIRARQIVTANTNAYRGLEGNRRRRRSPFALLYLGVTLVIVLAAIWTGIAVADRLVRPIRQLIGAADEVATGNLDVSVPVRVSDGDVAHLGDTFNKMLLQLKSQRNEILTAKDLVDERRAASRRPCSPASRRASSASIRPARSPSSTARPRPCSAFRRRPASRTRNISGGASPCRARSSRSAATLRQAGLREQVTFYRTGAEAPSTSR